MCVIHDFISSVSLIVSMSYHAQQRLDCRWCSGWSSLPQLLLSSSLSLPLIGQPAADHKGQQGYFDGFEDNESVVG
jgi:hypothetical protein